MRYSLPESYAAYVTQKDVRTAIDHILDSKSLEVPSDLDWNQLPDFHAAVLAAYQVRSDYASALQGFWNEVWRPALESSDLQFEALSILESQELIGRYTDTKSIWNSKQFWRYYRKKKFLVVPGVSLDIGTGQLWIWLGDKSLENSETEKLLLSTSSWYIEEEEESGLSYGYTWKELSSVTGAGIELDRLCTAAAQALKNLSSIMET